MKTKTSFLYLCQELSYSKPIINYDEFFISRNELTNSMAPEKEMDNLVVETAIISSRGPEIRPNKRNKAKEENNATTNSYILPEQLFQQE